jgi:hypothetical protein
MKVSNTAEAMTVTLPAAELLPLIRGAKGAAKVALATAVTMAISDSLFAADKMPNENFDGQTVTIEGETVKIAFLRQPIIPF